MSSGRLIETAGRIPVMGQFLRWVAHHYAEGSVITIKHGEAAGYRWKRHHRYVNGYWIGHYELDIQNALKRELRSGDTFFDVGANAGFFTLVAAKLVGPSGKCIAFDPVPANQESLREQIELNGLRHCHIVEAAVSDAPGEATFSFSAANSAIGQLGSGAPDADTAITVKVVTLDEVSQQHGPPAFIKLDVEGAEDKVVRGATRLISQHRPNWLIEIHTLECEAAVRETLHSAGYQFFRISGEPIAPAATLPHHVIARHPARSQS